MSLGRFWIVSHRRWAHRSGSCVAPKRGARVVGAFRTPLATPSLRNAGTRVRRHRVRSIGEVAPQPPRTESRAFAPALTVWRPRAAQAVDGRTVSPPVQESCPKVDSALGGVRAVRLQDAPVRVSGSPPA